MLRNFIFFTASLLSVFAQYVNAQTPAFSEMANYTPLLNYFQTPNTFQKCTDAADLNGDGFHDMVSIGTYSSSYNIISVQYGNCTGFFATNADTITVPFMNGPAALRIADINNDTHNDLLVCGAGTLAYYQGDGTGNFNTPLITSVPVSGILPGRTDMSVADFNQDGSLDAFICVHNQSFSPDQITSLLIGNSTGNFTISTTDFNIFSFLPYGSTDTADVNNDGWTDVVIASGLVFYNNSGVLDSVPIQALYSPNPNDVIRSVRTVNADNDAAIEFFSVSDSILIYGELDSINPVTASAITQSATIRSFDVGDFDGDGYDDDVILSFLNANPKFYRGNNGILSLVTTNYHKPVSGKVFAFDPDQDGDDEVYYTGNQKVLLNLGDFRFAYDNMIPLNGSVRATCSADFNLDGFEDAAVIVNAATTNTLSILYGKVCGFDGITEYPGYVQYNEIKTGNFNSDSLPDLVVSSQLYDSIFIYLNQGNKSFAPRQGYYTGHNLIQPAVADFNEDGLDDLFLLSTSPVRYNMMYADASGNGTFGTAGPLLSAATISVFGEDPEVADFNLDGHADVIISHDNALGQRMTILSGDGSGNFTLTALTMGVATTYCAPIHLNNDSLPDIITTAGSFSPVTSFLCNDTVTNNWTGPCQSSISQGSATITVADLNNDSITDFTLNSMNNAVLTSLPYILKPDYTPYYLQQVLSTGQSHASAVDFNADGFRDLVYFSGNNLVPFLNTMPASPQLIFSNDTLFVAPLRTLNVPSTYEWYKDGLLIPGASMNFLPVTGTGLYQVGIVYTNWTYSTAKYYVSSLSASPELDPLSFELFPNPSSAEITLRFTRIPASVDIQFLDLTGKLVYETFFRGGQNALTLNIEAYAAGLYFIRLSNGDFSVVRKFVKN